MRTAITHKPSPSLKHCELTFLASEPIDFEKAELQHKSYREALSKLGVEVITLDENQDLPDSVFVEDTAVVLDEVASVCSMGALSRDQETLLIKTELSRYRDVRQILPPAKVEGGDVLTIGKKLFVGVSSRTNIEGISALRNIVNPFGYEVIQVNMAGCLHLKTGCTALDDQTVLINPEWVDPSSFGKFKKVEVPDDEPFAANVLRIGNVICIHRGFRQTREVIEKLGYYVEQIDISEFLKAEAGLTCMSLLFER